MACGELQSVSLGYMVHDLFKGRVTYVRKGKRNDRKCCYKNLSRRHPADAHRNPCQSRENVMISFDDINALLHQMKSDNEISENWNLISNHQQMNVIFIRHENWKFNCQRGLLEILLKVDQVQQNCLTVTIRSHGCEVELNKHASFDYIWKLSGIREQVLLIFRIVDRSALCFGYKLPEEQQEIVTLLPHVSGTFATNDNSNENIKETRAFSAECELFSFSETRCKKCAHLMKMDVQRKERKSNVINPICNKRFLDSAEIYVQLKEQRRNRINAEKRERYWRNKYEEEMIDMEEGDHNDLSSIMNLVDKRDIPPDMVCLWDNQQQVLNAKGKAGFRWHPK